MVEDIHFLNILFFLPRETNNRKKNAIFANALFL